LAACSANALIRCCAEDLAGHLPEEHLLALEVIEEGGRRDIGRFGDLLDGGCLEATSEEELAGGAIDAGSQLPLLALTPSFDDRFSS
jgi:hypothetical protein